MFCPPPKEESSVYRLEWVLARPRLRLIALEYPVSQWFVMYFIILVTLQSVVIGNVPACPPLSHSPLCALYPVSAGNLYLLWGSVICSSWIIWPLAEPDHGLVEVIFSGNGSRTSWLSGRVRRQAHYSSILALQASGIIFHNQVWHDRSAECIKFLLAFFFLSSLPPPTSVGGVSPPPPLPV